MNSGQSENLPKIDNPRREPSSAIWSVQGGNVTYAPGRRAGQGGTKHKVAYAPVLAKLLDHVLIDLVAEGVTKICTERSRRNKLPIRRATSRQFSGQVPRGIPLIVCWKFFQVGKHLTEVRS
jgi:hypothetical protein